ncbi:MAG: hypothetical protein AB1578_08245 [Thermodesulfobacteriota bacterium]
MIWAEGYARERRRELRLQRFGLGLGLLLALVLHAVLFWGPQVSYRPALEEVRVRRVLVAQPYRPAVPPPTPQVPPAQPDRAHLPAAAPALAPELARVPVPSPTPPVPGGGDRVREGTTVPTTTETGLSVAAAPREEPLAGRAPAGSPDEWAALFAELQARGKEIAAQDALHRAESEAAVAHPVGREAGKGGYLDPRIRTKVVSYPPTSVETSHPPIPYPDLRFHREELQAGICRVWYRVGTDRSGRVARTQLKAPSTRADLARYAPFVDAVKQSVDRWVFDRTEAEVHVDVLFEIE